MLRGIKTKIYYAVILKWKKCIKEGIKHSVALYKIYSILCSKFYLFIFSIFSPYFCRQHTMSKLSRAIKFIMAIWIVAFCLAIPQAIQFGIVTTLNGGRSCTVNIYIYFI